jgi:hypothetical protein
MWENSTYVEKLASVDTSSWYSIIDTTTLDLGHRYKLCLDIDGPALSLDFGESGVDVFVSGVIAASSFVRLSSRERIHVTCLNCTADTRVLLAPVCDAEVFTSDRSSLGALSLPRKPLFGEGQEWTTDLNVTSLTVGKSYSLCINYDGTPSGLSIGPSGFEVYVTGLSALVFVPPSMEVPTSATTQMIEYLDGGCTTPKSTSSMLARVDWSDGRCVGPAQQVGMVAKTFDIACHSNYIALTKYTSTDCSGAGSVTSLSLESANNLFNGQCVMELGN